MSEYIITTLYGKKETILLTLVSYGLTQRHYLLDCLKEYNSFNKYSIFVHLLLTEDLDCSEFSNLNIVKHIYPISIGTNLPNEHRPIFYENIGKFNYYIHAEDDIMITEQNVDEFVSIQKNLPLPYITGFIRWEQNPDDDYKYLFDIHPAHSVHRNGNTVIKSNYIIKNEPYFEVYNFHQGSYIATKEILEYIKINNVKYFEKVSHYAGVVEGSASDIYFICGLIKVIPRNKISELLVHHMSNKYVNMLPDVYTKETTTDDIKLKILQIDLEPIIV